MSLTLRATIPRAQAATITWPQIIDRAFAQFRQAAAQFDGIVYEHSDAGLIAVFGAPYAQDTHAERACYAALLTNAALADLSADLRDRSGITFAPALGLHSGLLTVAPVAGASPSDACQTGAVGDVARTIAMAAPAGGILVSRDTADLVGGLFTMTAAEPVVDARRAGPALAVFHLQGVSEFSTRFDFRRARGLVPLVGRETILAALDDALTRAGAGRGQVVGVVGEAGIGKSRVAHEFALRARARGYRVFEIAGLLQGRDLPFFPIVRLLRAYFGVTPADDAAGARRKVDAIVLELDPGLRDLLPVLHAFMGIGTDDAIYQRSTPDALQHRLAGLLGRLHRLHASHSPYVVVLDDAHWLDPQTEWLLGEVIPALADTPSMLLLTARPHYAPQWMNSFVYTRVSVPPLTGGDVEQLLHALMGDDPSLEGLGPLIQDRTRGNPFFIEEVVQALATSGVLRGRRGVYRLHQPLETIQVPLTVRAAVADRIDRLPPPHKLVLQTAAVVGREFSESVLRTVAPLPAGDVTSALSGLTEAGLLQETSFHPSIRYDFVHPMLQEVAYEALLPEARAAAHAAVARAVLHGAAADAGPDGGETDFGEAGRHWGAVRRLLPAEALPQDHAPLALESRLQALQVGWRIGVAAADAEAILREAQTLASQMGDARILLLVNASHAMSGMLAGTAPSVHACEEALRAAEAAGEAALDWAGRSLLLFAYFLAGQPDKALAITTSSLAAPPPDLATGADVLGFSPYLHAEHCHSMLLAYLGRLPEANAQRLRALALVRQHAARELEVLALASGALLARFTGHGDGVEEEARAALRLAEDMGSVHAQVYAKMCLALAHRHAGGWEEVRHWARQGLRHVRVQGAGRAWEAWFLILLAEAAVELGDAARGRDLAAEAAALSAARALRAHECESLLCLATVHMRTGGPAEADLVHDYLMRAHASVHETGCLAYAGPVREARAEWHRLAGRTAEWRAELAAALRLFQRAGADGHAARIAATLAAA